ncbi:hypothetical protein I4U23_007125 [Adineta vaga]|nr:hypothetical protein I4U23_007125 [Adineta vaga]
MCYLIVNFLIFLASLAHCIVSIRLSCYANANLTLPSDAVLYDNITIKSCQCLSIQQSLVYGFQYDKSTNSCYIFDSNVSISDLHVKINSRVCFINQSSSLSYTSTSVIPSSSQIISFFNYISTTSSGSRFYQEEAVQFENIVTLTELKIIITVQKTPTLTGPHSYVNIGGAFMLNTINTTSTQVVYTFELINGSIIQAGNWTVVAQYYINNQMRDLSNDTYSVQIGSYKIADGYF